MTTTRVLIADGNPLIVRGLRCLLSGAPDATVAGEASDAEAVLHLSARCPADVLLLGSGVAGGDLEDVVARLGRAAPGLALLLLQTGAHDPPTPEIARGGIAGYLACDEEPHFILQAVRGAARGEVGWISRRLIAHLLRGDAHGSGAADLPLTRREREVLTLIAQGGRNLSVAKQLFISPDTVKNHLTKIYGKINVRSRGEAVAWAWRAGLTPALREAQ